MQPQKANTTKQSKITDYIKKKREREDAEEPFAEPEDSFEEEPPIKKVKESTLIYRRLREKKFQYADMKEDMEIVEKEIELEEKKLKVVSLNNSIDELAKELDELKKEAEKKSEEKEGYDEEEPQVINLFFDIERINSKREDLEKTRKERLKEINSLLKEGIKLEDEIKRRKKETDFFRNLRDEQIREEDEGRWPGEPRWSLF